MQTRLLSSPAVLIGVFGELTEHLADSHYRFYPCAGSVAHITFITKTLRHAYTRWYFLREFRRVPVHSAEFYREQCEGGLEDFAGQGEDDGGDAFHQLVIHSYSAD